MDSSSLGQKAAIAGSPSVSGCNHHAQKTTSKPLGFAHGEAQVSEQVQSWTFYEWKSLLLHQRSQAAIPGFETTNSQAQNKAVLLAKTSQTTLIYTRSPSQGVFPLAEPCCLPEVPKLFPAALLF